MYAVPAALQTRPKRGSARKQMRCRQPKAVLRAWASAGLHGCCRRLGAVRCQFWQRRQRVHALKRERKALGLAPAGAAAARHTQGRPQSGLLSHSRQQIQGGRHGDDPCRAGAHPTLTGAHGRALAPARPSGQGAAPLGGQGRASDPLPAPAARAKCRCRRCRCLCLATSR